MPRDWTDVFITGDRNLSFQQNMPSLTLTVIVLQAVSIRLADTAPLADGHRTW